jgi:tartrate-resistant acid phosphatase type 5
MNRAIRTYGQAQVEPLDRRVLLASSTARFAVIGDYGTGTAEEADVAALVHSWNPDVILTTGDNNYSFGLASDIDPHIGQFYHDYIYPYTGSYGAGAAGTNKFFPVLGNHDWGDVAPYGDASAYLNYFTLPGNERYYDFVRGPVHYFIIDSDANEPDGTTPDSVQGQWLKNQLALANEPHKIVLFHHAPYSSSNAHGSTLEMRWPFAAWGATAVFSGHDHVYERLEEEGIPYFVDGLGGASLYGFADPIPGSIVRYADDYGAMLVTADESSMNFKFYTRAGALIDNYTLQLCVVTSASFNYDARPMSLQFTFSQNVSSSLSAADLVLRNSTTQHTIPAAPTSLNYNPSTNVATFTFPTEPNGTLPDGNYIAALDTAGGITDSAGRVLSAANSSYSFFNLAADANRDRVVDVADLGIVAANWQGTLRTFSQGDSNYDGAVDVTDLGILATNWQKALAATPAVAAPAKTGGESVSFAASALSSAPGGKPHKDDTTGLWRQMELEIVLT